jgi:hypothetical protein
MVDTLLPGKVVDFSKLFQPYIIAGHCFDYSLVAVIPIHGSFWKGHKDKN